MFLYSWNLLSVSARKELLRRMVTSKKTKTV
jgi:hypothetical protein